MRLNTFTKDCLSQRVLTKTMLGVDICVAPLISKYILNTGIEESLALERKIESKKRNFSLDLENLIVAISLSTLNFREWQQKILFPLSIFESGKKQFSFYSRFSKVARQNSLSTLDFREWQDKILFPLSIFLSIFESSNREFNIISPSH